MRYARYEYWGELMEKAKINMNDGHFEKAHRYSYMALRLALWSFNSPINSPWVQQTQELRFLICRKERESQ